MRSTWRTFLLISCCNKCLRCFKFNHNVSISNPFQESLLTKSCDTRNQLLPSPYNVVYSSYFNSNKKMWFCFIDMFRIHSKNMLLKDNTNSISLRSLEYAQLFNYVELYTFWGSQEERSNPWVLLLTHSSQ